MVIVAASLCSCFDTSHTCHHLFACSHFLTVQHAGMHMQTVLSNVWRHMHQTGRHSHHNYETVTQSHSFTCMSQP